LTVRYFSARREARGSSSEEVDTDAATLGALRRELAARDDAHAEMLAPEKAVRAALDRVMASDEAPLADGAEVAFFPPVTGG